MIDLTKVLTYKPSNNKIDFLDYTEKTIHTEHGKMYKITTESGHSIKPTDDHSLATIGKGNFFSPIPPQDSLGAFVPIPFRLDFLQDDNDFSSDKLDEENLLTWPSVYLFSHFLEKAINQSGAIVTKTDKELAETEYLLFKSGIYYEINGSTLNIYPDSFGYIPELDSDGSWRLVPRECSLEENTYRLLPLTWSKVVSVEEVEREDVTYDFTVPEFPLFIGNSILVYDTMQVHVPVTEEAKEDALTKMLPSKNLFSARTLEPTMLPQQESTYGCFLASKPSKEKPIAVTSIKLLEEQLNMGTYKPNHPAIYNGHLSTAGIILINDALPLALRDYTSVWDKSVISRILSKLGKSEPNKYTAAADRIKELGAEFSYKLGASFDEKDFDLDSLKKKRNIVFDKVEAQMKAVDNSEDSKENKYSKKVELLRGAQDSAQKLTADATSNHFQQWAYSGSRGSKSQVMQIIASPTVVSDPRDRVIPMLIRNSYNEGLTPADYWVSSYGTRKGTVSAKLSVAPGGAMAKEVIGNVLDQVVSEHDCGSKDGIYLPINDTKDVLDRYEAGTNRMINPRYYEQLKLSDKEKVLVRSPIKCHAGHGVCQMCYGCNEKGTLPEIGENVGVQAAQAITEPLTQMGLSSKHTAGTAAEEKVGLNTISKFFTMPNQYAGAATIANASGIVTNIEPAPAGGTSMWIGKKKYHIIPGHELKVKIGDNVAAGDILTSGLPNLQHIVKHKGIDYGRELFVHHANDLYNRAGAPSIRKNFETVARGLINYVHIDSPGDFPFIEGDIVDYNSLMEEIRKNPTKLKPTFTPYQKGTTEAAQRKPDWLANFGFKFLKKNIIENAATGVTSMQHGYHPVAGYAMSDEFGKGKDGKY